LGTTALGLCLSVMSVWDTCR